MSAIVPDDDREWVVMLLVIVPLIFVLALLAPFLLIPQDDIDNTIRYHKYGPPTYVAPWE